MCIADIDNAKPEAPKTEETRQVCGRTARSAAGLGTAQIPGDGERGLDRKTVASAVSHSGANNPGGIYIYVVAAVFFHVFGETKHA